MTQPQPDPAADVGAAVARLAEQSIGLQRQLTRMEAVNVEQAHVAASQLRDAEARIRELTDAKFATYETLITSQAEKVALALDATEKAIGKAETATSKAIEKEATANESRFASVNEFRKQLNDQAATFMPRTEAVQLSDQAMQRIRELADLVPQLATRLEVQVMADRSSERIGELNDRMNRAEGRGLGVKDNKAGIYAAIAGAVGLIAVFVFLANLLTTR
jgi:hypothetical protein